MALTRARVVQGDDRLTARIHGVIQEVLTRPRDAKALLADVADMRRRMRREHSRPADADPWNLKHRPGGLIDAEFIVQYLLLRTPVAMPVLQNGTDLSSRTCVARLMTADALSSPDGKTLQDGLALWSSLQVMLRLTLGDEIPAGLPLGLQVKLASVAKAKDFSDLEAQMHRRSADISALFSVMIEGPAASLPPGEATTGD
jgi:glutamate-ammonia-ligase adenylyltransferase